MKKSKNDIYDKIEEMLNLGKGSDYLVVLGNVNVVVGEGSDGLVAGSFGLVRRNEREDILIEFCERKNLTIANAYVEHNLRRRYTWKDPGDTRRLRSYNIRGTATV